MKQIFTIAFIIILFRLTVSGQEYHVATNGNDNNSGGINAPWLNIQYAVDQAEPGSTIYIHEGIYNTTFTIVNSGLWDNYTEILNYNNDEVIIDATNQSAESIVSFNNVSYFKIEGLIFRNNEKLNATGIRFETLCSNIEINNCEIYNINFSGDPNAGVLENSYAFAMRYLGSTNGTFFSDFKITNCHIHDCRVGHGSALYLNNDIDFVSIIGNDIHDITNHGIHLHGYATENSLFSQAPSSVFVSENEIRFCNSENSLAKGINIDGANSITIDRNLIAQNDNGIDINCHTNGRSTQQVTMSNNIIHSNQNIGISMGSNYPNFFSGKVSFGRIVNNTIYGNNLSGSMKSEIHLGFNEQSKIYRNIIVSKDTNGRLLRSTFDSSEFNLDFQNNNWYNTEGGENLYYNEIEYTDMSTWQGLNNVSNPTAHDPSFISEFNFQLTSDSPLIDIGGDSGFLSGEFDFYGDERIVNGLLDIGADEFKETDVSVQENDFENGLFYPNPCVDHLNINQSLINESNSLVVYDFSEKVVFKNVRFSNRIDVGNLNPGIYLFQILNDQNDLLHQERVVIR